MLLFIHQINLHCQCVHIFKKNPRKLKRKVTHKQDGKRTTDRRKEKRTERHRNIYLFDMPSPRLSQNQSALESSGEKNELIWVNGYKRLSST